MKPDEAIKFITEYLDKNYKLKAKIQQDDQPYWMLRESPHVGALTLAIILWNKTQKDYNFLQTRFSLTDRGWMLDVDAKRMNL
ncbi:TPA: hypothetical protein JA361_08540 [Legionella pneumophila]|nr:hypothetical protein [Legionella pneumophila]HAT8182740.1 hypothetical protein [Legionella pneumophila]